MQTLRQTSSNEVRSLDITKSVSESTEHSLAIVHAYSTDNVQEVCSIGRDGKHDMYHRNTQDIPDINLTSIMPDIDDEHWPECLSEEDGIHGKVRVSKSRAWNVTNALEFKSKVCAPTLALVNGVDAQYLAVQPHLGSQGKHLWWASEVSLSCPNVVPAVEIPAHLGAYYQVAGSAALLSPAYPQVPEIESSVNKVLRPMNPLVRNNDNKQVNSAEKSVWQDADMNEYRAQVHGSSRKTFAGVSKLSDIHYSPQYEASDQTCAETEQDILSPHHFLQNQWSVRMKRKSRHSDCIEQQAVRYYVNYYLYAHVQRQLSEVGKLDEAMNDREEYEYVPEVSNKEVHPSQSGAQQQYQVYHEILLREHHEAHSVTIDEESVANADLQLKNLAPYLFYAQYVLFSDIPDERVCMSQRGRSIESVAKSLENASHMSLDGKYALLWLQEYSNQSNTCEFPGINHDDNSYVNPGYLEMPTWLNNNILHTNCTEPPENRKHITTNITITEKEQVSKTPLLLPIQLMMCNEDFFELSVLIPLRQQRKVVKNGCVSTYTGYCRCSTLIGYVEDIILQPKILGEYCPEQQKHSNNDNNNNSNDNITNTQGTPCERLLTSQSLAIHTIEALQFTSVTRQRDDCVDADREYALWLAKRAPIGNSEELNTMQMAGDFPFDHHTEKEDLGTSLSNLQGLRTPTAELDPLEGLSNQQRHMLQMNVGARNQQFQTTIKSGNIKALMQLLANGVSPFSDDNVGLGAIDYVSILDADNTAKQQLHSALHLFQTMSVKDYTGADSYIHNSYAAWGYDHVNIPLRIAKHGHAGKLLQDILNHSDDIYQDMIFCLEHESTILPSPEILAALPVSAYPKAQALLRRLPKAYITSNYLSVSPFSVLAYSPRREAFETWCAEILPPKQSVTSFERLASLCRLFDVKTEEPQVEIPRELLHPVIRGICNRLNSSSLRRSVSQPRPLEHSYVPPNQQDLGVKSFIPCNFVLDTLYENSRTTHYAMLRGLQAITTVSNSKSNIVQKYLQPEESPVISLSKGLCHPLKAHVQIGKEFFENPNLRKLYRNSVSLGGANTVFLMPVCIKMLGNYLNHTRYRHWSALTLAASGCNYKVIRMLSDLGLMDFERPSGCGLTALNCAIKSTIRAEKKKELGDGIVCLPQDDELGSNCVVVKGKQIFSEKISTYIPPNTPQDGQYKGWKTAAYLYTFMRVPRVDSKFVQPALGQAMLADAQVKRGLGLHAIVSKRLHSQGTETALRAMATEIANENHLYTLGVRKRPSKRGLAHIRTSIDHAAMYQGQIHVSRNALSSCASTTPRQNVYSDTSLAVLVTDLASVPLSTSWLCRKSTPTQASIDALQVAPYPLASLKQYREKILFRVPVFCADKSQPSHITPFPTPEPIINLITQFIGDIPLTPEHNMTHATYDYIPSSRTILNDTNFGRLVPCNDTCECHCHCRFCC